MNFDTMSLVQQNEAPIGSYKEVNSNTLVKHIKKGVIVMITHRVFNAFQEYRDAV